jgi:hypothetical protein
MRRQAAPTPLPELASSLMLHTTPRHCYKYLRRVFLITKLTLLYLLLRLLVLIDTRQLHITMAATVNVENISMKTSEDEIKSFFSFCGKIQSLSVKPTGDDTQVSIRGTM